MKKGGGGIGIKIRIMIKTLMIWLDSKPGGGMAKGRMQNAECRMQNEGIGGTGKRQNAEIGGENYK